jgi:hypothetical protein
MLQEVGSTDPGRESLDRSTTVVLAAAPLLGCAGALPRLVQVGGLTPVGVASFVLVFAAVVVLLRRPVTAAAAVPVVGLWSLFVAWLVLTTPVRAIDSIALQEITADLLIPLVVVLAARQAWVDRRWLATVDRLMGIQFWGLLAIYAVQWTAYEVTGNDLLNIRPIAMSAVFLGAWYLGRFVMTGRDVRRLVTLGVLITVSLSRMAFAVYLLMAVIALMVRAVRNARSRRSGGLRIVVVTLLVGALGAVLLLGVGPLHSRSTTGGVSITVAGVSINGEGRADFWRVLREHSAGVGVGGLGAGAAQRVINENFTDIGQPHNDYLKLWFNSGWVGLGLFLAGWLMAARQLLRALGVRQAGSGERAAAVAALLSGLALLVFMATDNPIAYVVVTGQWALVLGTALGLAARGGTTDGEARSVRRRSGAEGPGIPQQSGVGPGPCDDHPLVHRRLDAPAVRTVPAPPAVQAERSVRREAPPARRDAPPARRSTPPARSLLVEDAAPGPGRRSR